VGMNRRVSTKGLCDLPSLAGRSKAFKYLFRVYLQSCLRRGIEFALSPEEFSELIQGCCAYCGIPPSNRTKLRSCPNIDYSGIDRIENSNPYRRGNVVSCCKTCNSMKGKMSRTEFVTHIRRIAAHQSGRRGSLLCGQISMPFTSEREKIRC
jgi:hypothetical protein